MQVLKSSLLKTFCLTIRGIAISKPSCSTILKLTDLCLFEVDSLEFVLLLGGEADISGGQVEPGERPVRRESNLKRY